MFTLLAISHPIIQLFQHPLTDMSNTGKIRKIHSFCDYKLYCVRIKAALCKDAYNMVLSCHILIKLKKQM